MVSLVGLAVGDKLELKKNHPCGRRLFEVTNVGSDVRIRCLTCGRELLIDRAKLEKSVKRFVQTEENNER